MSVQKKILWLMLDRGVRFAASLANGALIARALSPNDFGLLTQALLVLAFLDTVSSLGLPSVMGSRVAVAPLAERSGLLLRVLTLRSAVAMACALLAYFAFCLAPQTEMPTNLVFAILLTLVLSNWTISDGYLQGLGNPEQGALVKTIVALTFVFVRWLYIASSQPSPVSLAFIYCIEQAMLSLAMLAVCWCRRPVMSVSTEKPSTERTPLFRHALVMWASQLVTLVYMRADQIIISVIGNRTQLAEYAVAAQLAEQAYTLPIILNAVFVSQIGAIRKTMDPRVLQQTMRTLYRQGFIAAVLLTILAAGISELLLPAIFGDRYQASAPLFMILVCAIPFVTLGSLQSLFIFTGENPSVQLKKTTLAALLSIPAGLLGWAFLGVHGLALSVVVVQSFSCVLSNRLFDPSAFRSQLHAMSLWRKLP